MKLSALLPFFLVAAAYAFIVIRRKKAQEAKYQPKDITPVVSRDIFIEYSTHELRRVLTEKLATQEIFIHTENESRIVFDSKNIGAFHWGFLYTADFQEKPGGTLLTLGIFGKGPNPPRMKTQEGYLNTFVNERVMPL